MKKIYLWPASLAVIYLASIIIIISPIRDQNILPMPTPAMVKTTDTPTSALWQTYRNDKYGFEIKHPSNLVVTEANGRITFDTNPPGFKPALDILTSKTVLPKMYISKLISEYGVGSVKQENLFINGNKLTKVVFGNETGSKTEYLVENRGSLLILTDYANLVSSLKILPDISLWKTYRSKKYNLSFKYPNHYQVKDVTIGPNDFYSNAIFISDIKSKLPNIIKIFYEPNFNKLCPAKTCTKKAAVTIGNNVFIPFSEGMSLTGFYSNNTMVLSLMSDVDENEPVFSEILASFNFTR